jgi:hypothetical protein
VEYGLVPIGPREPAEWTLENLTLGTPDVQTFGKDHTSSPQHQNADTYTGGDVNTTFVQRGLGSPGQP